MANFFLQQPRLSYAQAVLPLFRTMLAGGVLAMLALLGGFVAPPPDEPRAPAVPVQVANLPPSQAAEALEDVTGPAAEPQASEMTVEIGEASAIELPIEAFDVPVQGERPETFWQPATPAR